MPASGRYPWIPGFNSADLGAVASVNGKSGAQTGGAVTLDATDVGAFANPMTTAGDLILGGTAGAATRLAKGTDGQILTMVAGVPTWVTPA